MKKNRSVSQGNVLVVIWFVMKKVQEVIIMGICVKSGVMDKRILIFLAHGIALLAIMFPCALWCRLVLMQMLIQTQLLLIILDFMNVVTKNAIILI